MQFSRVCTSSKKLLVCAGLAVSFHALGSNICLAQQRIDRSIKLVDSVDSPLVACLEPCHDAGCINTCIATQTVPLARRVAFNSAPQSSVTDCFAAVRENITMCGRAFLVPIESADWESFSYCRAVATMVFASCPAFESSLDPASTLEIGTLCLERTVQMAENTIAQAQAGQLEPLTHTGSFAVVYDDGSQIQKDSSALTQQAISPIMVVTIAFGICLGDFQDNLFMCTRAFPDNGTAINKFGLKTCLKVAAARFQACAVGKVKVVQETP